MVQLLIDQNGNNRAIYIDSESTTYDAIRIQGSKYGIYSQQDLADGYAGYFTRDLNETGSNPLVFIKDDHTANTQAALKIQQDGAGYGIHLDQNGNNIGLLIGSDSTTANVLYVSADAVTTGSAAYFYSASTALASTATGGLVEIISAGDTDTNVNNLLYIHNDHADSTGTTALKVKQDSTGAAIIVEGGNIVIGTAGKGIDFSATSDGAGTDTSELLDDYEEGTWTPTWSGANASSATYTKIGRVVYASGQFAATGSGTTGSCGGLPYASAIDGSDGGGSGYHGQDTVSWNILKVSSTGFRFYTGSTQKQLTSSNGTRFFLTYHV